MKFIETPLADLYILEPDYIKDERGFFARTFCVEEFRKRGLSPSLAQCNISYNSKKGTLRGMHFQIEPHGEDKVVRCTQGAIFDVVIDLRKESPTFKKWFAAELTAENRKMVYVPTGFAHGFQTLEDHTEVFYQMSALYHAESARGVRWDDPTFAIDWPSDERTISLKDQYYPPYL